MCNCNLLGISFLFPDILVGSTTVLLLNSFLICNMQMVYNVHTFCNCFNFFFNMNYSTNSRRAFFFSLPYEDSVSSTWPRLVYRGQLRARHCVSSILLHCVTHVIDAHSRRSYGSKCRASTASYNEETWGIGFERETRAARGREKKVAPLVTDAVIAIKRL